MFIARFARFCVALALGAALSGPASAQTANPFKKPAAATQATTPAAPAAPLDKATPDAAKKPPSEAQLASRARMKECGAEWQGMKKAGQTKGKTWREFSSECLKKK